MKKLRIFMSVIFFGMLFVPVLLMERTENVTSEIDNRKLTNNPFGENYEPEGEYDLTEAIESYLQDRIGFRNEMIREYTVLNDVLFHEMVHPTYTYGKDDYVFFKLGVNARYGEYQDIFADMVKKVQDYCEERDVPFVFVFNPSKASVMKDKLPAGVNYDNSWVAQFMDELEKRQINYIDNTEMLIEKTEQGEAVFNQQFNAGHWNDLGAFYGTNQILEVLKKEIPETHVNDISEFEIEQKLNTSLMVSEFPIQEYEPIFTAKEPFEDITSQYDAEVKRDEQYGYFIYTKNSARKETGSPKTLVFQGSYMNGMGYKFLQNSLGEYIGVHDYQNIMNIDYYFNIFQPEAVVFEVAEYVFNDGYFSSEKMKNMQLNPSLESLNHLPKTEKALSDISVSVEEGEKLVNVQIHQLPVMTKYAYLKSGDKVFDLKRQSNDGDVRYEASIDKQWYQEGNLEVIVTDGSSELEVYK